METDVYATPIWLPGDSRVYRVKPDNITRLKYVIVSAMSNMQDLYTRFEAMPFTSSKHPVTNIVNTRLRRESRVKFKTETSSNIELERGEVNPSNSDI